MIVAIGAAIIALGYLMMSTENFIDAKEFSLSLHVSPVLIVLGHIAVIVGILWRDESYAEDKGITEENTKKV